MKAIKNSKAYAFCLGFLERYRFNDGFGRTHPLNQDWNEAYDRGANLCDWLAH